MGELHFGDQHASQVAFWIDLVKHKLSFLCWELNVQFSDLADLCQEVADFDFVVDLQHHSHGLIVVHVIVALRELGEMLPVTSRLTAVHPLQGTSSV